MVNKISKVHSICPVCGSHKVNKIFSDSDNLMKKKYQYMRCSECGLLFISPFPTQRGLNKIYNLKNNPIERSANKLLFSFNDIKYLQKLFHLFAVLVNKDRAKYMEKYSTRIKEKYVFDFGCGVGRFIEEMAKRGWRVGGQDLNRKAVEITRTRLEGYRPYLTGNMPVDVKLPKEVSVITLWHVYEHIPNFHSVMKLFTKKLSKNKYIVIECPNADALSIKLFGKFSTNVITPEHLTFWSDESYRKLLQKYNFEVLNVSFSNSFIFTSASSSYNYFLNKVGNTYVSLLMAAVVASVSIPIYLLMPRFREAIKVCAIRT